VSSLFDNSLSFTVFLFPHDIRVIHQWSFDERYDLFIGGTFRSVSRSSHILKRWGRNSLYLPIVEKSQSIKDNLHAALFNHMFNADFILMKFKVTIQPSKKGVDGV